ncbi:FAD-dependent monooxygenase [Cupriavidus basilensis]|uniref:FAD-dependent monooxygenase n=1 Tax=Cupriavidus basilensis TaxID=68895 RepID=A0ABT6AX01_9BURK|nr:FAD-dependent monooxygenase [Cupriavidus basilensis]MDF3836893.1 FAD-dependent monooxygenase [Cupriavidus basilensis]
MIHDPEAAPLRQGGQAIPVAIVGAGTAGSVLALLLASRGIRSVLVDRQSDADAHPRGHVWSARAMEVIRSIDTELAETLREISSPPLKLRYITWCTSLAGVELGRCVPIGSDPGHTARLLGSGPCRPLHLSQNVTDPILRQRVIASELIEFMPGYALEALSQEADGCTLTLREAHSGSTTRRTARFVAGADGAQSTVRRLLGVQSTTKPMQAVAQIHFRAQLWKLNNARPSPLYWILNPGVVGTLTAHTADDEEWVLSTAVLPDIEPAGAMTAARALSLVRAAIGDDSIDVEICSIRPWTMELRRAATSRVGRVLLLGDAAAGFSAIGGFGLNHGIEDAASLAWRLQILLGGFVHRDLAQGLLSSYAVERAESADAHAHLTQQLSALSDEVLRSAGVDPDGFKTLSALSRSAWAARLPKAFARKLFGSLLRGGLKPLGGLTANGPAGAQARTRVRRAIDKQREVFVTLGMDLGYAHPAGFMAREPHPHPASPNRATEYLPTTSPGALVPHLWSEADIDGESVSTRDLARRAPMTLLVNEKERVRWQAALSGVRGDWGIEVACPSIGDGVASQFRIDPSALAAALEIDASGAVLVRGDGIVVWRSRRHCADPSRALQAVMARLVSQSTKLHAAITAHPSKEMQ